MELDFQTGVAFGVLAVVLVYLANRFVVKPLRNSQASSEHKCGSDCKCGD